MGGDWSLVVIGVVVVDWRVVRCNCAHVRIFLENPQRNSDQFLLIDVAVMIDISFLEDDQYLWGGVSSGIVDS